MMRTLTSLLTAVALALTLSGCRIHVNRDRNGEEKNVRVDTPFGGVHVNTGQTTASNMGLPVYPGARVVAEKGDHNSADVRMGIGKWQLRVRAVSFESADSQEKVAAFYKKELSRYGDVITCQENKAVGQPASTREGLVCNDDTKAKVKTGSSGLQFDINQYELKAGSKQHQHIVGFEKPNPGKTRFAMVAIDLPSGSGDEADGGN